MPIKVVVPNALRPYAGGMDHLPLDAQTVGEALRKMVERYPALQGRLPEQVGLGHAIYRNGTTVNNLQGLDTPVSDGDVLTLIVPAGDL